MTCDEIDTAIAYYEALLGSLNSQISAKAYQISGASTVMELQDQVAGGPDVTDYFSAAQIQARMNYLGDQMALGGPAVMMLMLIMTGYQAILTLINEKAALEQLKVYPQEQLNALVLLRASQCGGSPMMLTAAETTPIVMRIRFKNWPVFKVAA